MISLFYVSIHSSKFSSPNKAVVKFKDYHILLRHIVSLGIYGSHSVELCAFLFWFNRTKFIISSQNKFNQICSQNTCASQFETERPIGQYDSCCLCRLVLVTLCCFFTNESFWLSSELEIASGRQHNKWQILLTHYEHNHSSLWVLLYKTYRINSYIFTCMEHVVFNTRAYQLILSWSV
jgi:hypothetical protein